MTMGKVRLEALSDGVLAIIITIMVLEMKVPHGTGFVALKPLIPVFLSYVLSFVYLGIYWNNYHHLMHAARHVNGPILWANLHLLFWLSLAGGALRNGVAVRWNRLFPPHENTHRPAWERLNSGTWFPLRSIPMSSALLGYIEKRRLEQAIETAGYAPTH